jgi:hypothetical protein
MKAACSSCGGPCDPGSRSGKCRPCWVKPVRMSGSCPCGARISWQNKSGLCKLCICKRNHSDPEIVARRAERTRQSNADPVLKAKRAEGTRRACRTPEERARRRAEGKSKLNCLSPKARERAFTPESIAKRAEARRATFARKRAERERAAHLETLTPFDRAMERVRNGANIIEVKPLRTCEPAFSMTGNSSAMAAGL